MLQEIGEDRLEHQMVLIGHIEALEAERNERLAALRLAAGNARSLSVRVRFQVLRRDKFTCQYCGAKAPDVQLEIDHVIPVVLGGSRELSNLRTACQACNAGKSAAVLDAARESAPADVARVLEIDEAIKLARIEWRAAHRDLRELDMVLAVRREPQHTEKWMRLSDKLVDYLVYRDRGLPD